MATERSSEHQIDISSFPQHYRKKLQSIPFQVDQAKGNFEMDTRKLPECVKAKKAPMLHLLFWVWAAEMVPAGIY